MQEKERQEPFYKVYRKDCGRGLNPKELLIISLVRSYEDDNKPFFMSNEYISKEIGLSKRAVQENINKLVGKSELFKREVRDNSRGQANSLRILSTKPLKEGVSIACGSTEPSAETAYGNTEPSAETAQKRMQKTTKAHAETAPYNKNYNNSYYNKSENTESGNNNPKKLTPEERKELIENFQNTSYEEFY